MKRFFNHHFLIYQIQNVQQRGLDVWQWSDGTQGVLKETQLVSCQVACLAPRQFAWWNASESGTPGLPQSTAPGQPAMQTVLGLRTPELPRFMVLGQPTRWLYLSQGSIPLQREFHFHSESEENHILWYWNPLQNAITFFCPALVMMLT